MSGSSDYWDTPQKPRPRSPDSGRAGAGPGALPSPASGLPAWFCLGENPGRHATESHAGWLPSSTPYLAQPLQCGTFGTLIRCPRLPSTSPHLHPVQSPFPTCRRSELLGYSEALPQGTAFQVQGTLSLPGPLLIMVWIHFIHFYATLPSVRSRREQDGHVRPFLESEADITPANATHPRGNGLVEDAGVRRRPEAQPQGSFRQVELLL